MENGAFLPFALLLLFIIQKAMKRAIFYNPVSRSWIEEKKWYHYVQYVVLVSVFAFACLTPFLPANFRYQIGRYYALCNGHTFVEYDDEDDKLYPNLPDTEFILGYEVKSSVKNEEIIETVLPAITEYHRIRSKLGVIRAFCGYDFSEEYKIRYDIERKVYLLYLGRQVAAEVTIERTLFFKKIFFHGYRDVYRMNAEKQNRKEGVIL